eukprot:GHVU01022330.1.p1 GENE.GHVU01022330.1~~GHVU01022330.1.p1  ORF type:complete len:136 (+),score=19.88 GHVU01022330.1:1296-1703(+)
MQSSTSTVASDFVLRKKKDYGVVTPVLTQWPTISEILADAGIGEEFMAICRTVALRDQKKKKTATANKHNYILTHLTSSKCFGPQVHRYVFVPYGEGKALTKSAAKKETRKLFKLMKKELPAGRDSGKITYNDNI